MLVRAKIVAALVAESADLLVIFLSPFQGRICRGQQFPLKLHFNVSDPTIDIKQERNDSSPNILRRTASTFPLETFERSVFICRSVWPDLHSSLINVFCRVNMKRFSRPVANKPSDGNKPSFETNTTGSGSCCLRMPAADPTQRAQATAATSNCLIHDI